MNLNPPIPRLERLRPGGPGRPADEADDPKKPLDRTTANQRPLKSRAGAVRRESHQADYVILVVVVALTAIGILMVYSSSALKGYLSQNADTFATVGPQIQWAILGLVAMALMMRVDYRYLRLASVPMYLVAARAAGPRVRARAQHRGRRIGPLAQVPDAPGGPPGGVREARPDRLSRALVRQAREARSAGSGAAPSRSWSSSCRSSPSCSRSPTSARRWSSR